MVSAPDGGFRELKADEWIYSQGTNCGSVYVRIYEQVDGVDSI